MGPTTDESWNQFGLDGVKKAKDDCGIDYAFTENVKQTEFEETMRNYAQEGYGTIIGHSGTFTDSAKSVASEFPETQFTVINAIEGNVHRVHLITHQQNGALLQELFTREGTGTLIGNDSLEELRQATVEYERHLW